MAVCPSIYISIHLSLSSLSIYLVFCLIWLYVYLVYLSYKQVSVIYPFVPSLRRVIKELFWFVCLPRCTQCFNFISCCTLPYHYLCDNGRTWTTFHRCVVNFYSHCGCDYAACACVCMCDYLCVLVCICVYACGCQHMCPCVCAYYVQINPLVVCRNRIHHNDGIG
jgi:hypothetical protein